jgi:uncharacterized membrane protein
MQVTRHVPPSAGSHSDRTGRTVPDVDYSGAYAVVLALHLIAVVFLVGPSAVTAAVSARHARQGHAEALRDGMRATRLYTLGTVVAVLLGSGLVGLGDVGSQWDMGQLWVSASYALWIVAVALQLGLVVPSQGKALQALAGGGGAQALSGRIAAGAGLASLCYVTIVVLMVAKPGA